MSERVIGGRSEPDPKAAAFARMLGMHVPGGDVGRSPVPKNEGVSGTLWTDLITGEVFRAVDAAFYPGLSAGPIQSRNSYRSPPKGHGSKR